MGFNIKGVLILFLGLAIIRPTDYKNLLSVVIISFIAILTAEWIDKMVRKRIR